MVRDKLLIFDTSLRDGEQAPGCSMAVKEKLLLARKLQRLGVDIIEAGFPVASPGDAEAVRSVAGEVEGPDHCSFCSLHRERHSGGLGRAERLSASTHPYLSFHLGYSSYFRFEDQPRRSIAQGGKHGGPRALVLRRC